MLENEKKRKTRSRTYKVYATAAGDGKELWSTGVPARIVDLAFNSGRLLVLCGSDTIVCFGE